MPVTSLGVERARHVRIDEPVEAVFETEHLDPGVAGGLDDGADDRVQAGGVAASGQDSNFLDS